MSRIAIVDLLFNWPPDGGARTDVKEIATRLSKDHEVCIFVPDFPRGFPRGQIRSKLDLNIRKISFNPLSFNFFQVPFRLKKEIDRFKSDFVFITDGWYLKPYVVIALKKYKPILRFYAYETICLRSHGHFYVNDKICNTNYLKGQLSCIFRCIRCSLKWLRTAGDKKFIHEFITALAFLPSYRNIARRAIMSASKVIVYNNFIKEKIRHLNRNILVIPSGVDPKLFSYSERFGDGKIKILMVGRVEDPLKGFPALYEACRLLHKKRNNFQLLLTTDLKFKEDYIVPVGWLNQEDLANLYREVDICVVPSIWPEPFGIVAIEAMASGKPLIIARVGGLQTIVKDRRSVFIINPRDADELFKKLLILINNRSLRREMGYLGRAEVINRYSWDRIYIKHYMDIFNPEARFKC